MGAEREQRGPRGERKSASADAAWRSQVEEERGMTVRERMRLALRLGVETQSIFDPQGLLADLGEGPLAGNEELEAGRDGSERARGAA